VPYVGTTPGQVTLLVVQQQVIIAEYTLLLLYTKYDRRADCMAAVSAR
jgi:hypothetical protein